MATSVVQDDVGHWLSPLSGYAVNVFFEEKAKIFFLGDYMICWLGTEMGIDQKTNAGQCWLTGRIVIVISVCSLASGEDESSLSMVAAAKESEDNQVQFTVPLSAKFFGVFSLFFVGFFPLL